MEGSPDRDELERRFEEAIRSAEAGEALEAFRAGNARFQREGFEAIAGAYHEDFELNMKTLLFDGRAYRGAEGFKAWRADIGEALEYDRFEPEAVRFGAGDAFAVLGRLHYKGRASGLEGTMPLVHVYEMRDGKIARQSMYDDASEALASIGAAE